MRTDIHTYRQGIIPKVINIEAQGMSLSLCACPPHSMDPLVPLTLISSLTRCIEYISETEKVA